MMPIAPSSQGVGQFDKVQVGSWGLKPAFLMTYVLITYKTCAPSTIIYVSCTDLKFWVKFLQKFNVQQIVAVTLVHQFQMNLVEVI